MSPIRWWHWLPRFRYFLAGNVEHADEVPERIPAKAAVLVGTLRQPKWLAFDCPCRTGHRILIPLDHSYRPHWQVLSTAPLTISPSVDYQTQKQSCHYFIRNGRVLWT
jgi:hypothetical protein